MNILSLFWKTYRVKYIRQDGELVSYGFLRGSTWEVVQMATKIAKEKSEKEEQIFAIEEIKRIY